ncbi:MAG: FtsX-like permease family protein, partial [Anaerolineae bacterium]
MMKAVGAQAGDIMGIYLMMAAAFGVLSLVIALPVGVALSRGMTRALATFLNVDVVSFAVPLWIFGVQAVTAILVPLGAALVPVLSGMRTTVREAISDYGIGS